MFIHSSATLSPAKTFNRPRQSTSSDTYRLDQRDPLVQQVDVAPACPDPLGDHGLHQVVAFRDAKAILQPPGLVERIFEAHDIPAGVSLHVDQQLLRHGKDIGVARADGAAARKIVGDEKSPVRWMIAGIVDELEPGVPV